MRSICWCATPFRCSLARPNAAIGSGIVVAVTGNKVKVTARNDGERRVGLPRSIFEMQKERPCPSARSRGLRPGQIHRGVDGAGQRFRD
jgi:hypothetical protein